MLRPAYPVRWHLRDPRNVVAAPVEPDPHAGCTERLDYWQGKWRQATDEVVKLRTQLTEAQQANGVLAARWEQLAGEVSLLRRTARTPVVLPPAGSLGAELLRMRAANALLDDRLAEAEGRPVQRAER